MASRPASLCIPCQLRQLRRLQVRSFASSSTHSQIPPESPNYIDIPSSYQPDLLPAKRPKGRLPVPRELFPKQRPDKPSEQYIRNATPDKLPHNQPTSLDILPEQKRHQLRMNTIRKSHLRTSLVDLHARKISDESRVARTSSSKQAERARILSQPPLPTDSLTATSTPTSLLPNPIPKPLTHPDPAALHASKQFNIIQHDLYGPRQTAGRAAALHDLYMTARTFITTEAQLNDAIEAQFPASGSNPQWATTRQAGTSVWNRGPPPSVAKMLEEQTGTRAGGKMGAAFGGRLGSDRGTAAHRRDQERLKRIAEELSGGKM